jgi:hypothetical protein
MRNIAVIFALLSALVFVGCISLGEIQDIAAATYDKAQSGQKLATAVGVINPSVGTALSGVLSIISLVASYIAKRDTSIAHERITRYKDKVDKALSEE